MNVVSKVRQIPRTYLVALIVLLFGFCAMGAFWALQSNKPGLIGWTHYRAATFGDGLLLPLLVATLDVCIQRLRQDTGTSPRRTACFAAFIVGVGLGSALQVSWLVDPRPEVNWSLPRPHHFAPSGYWHAAFLIAMSGVTSSLVFELSWQLRTAARSPSVWFKTELRDGWAPFIVLFAGWTFCGLVAADGGRGSSEITTVGSVVIVAIGSIALWMWSCRTQYRELMTHAMLALPASLGFVVLVERDPSSLPKLFPATIFVVVLIAVGNAVRDWPPARGVRCAIANACVAAPLVALPLGGPEHLARNLILAASAYLTAAGVRAIITREFRSSTLRDQFPWLICGTFPVAAVMGSQAMKHILLGGVVLIVGGIIFGRIVFPFCKADFDVFMKQEEAWGAGPNASRSRLGRLISVRLGFLGVASITGFLTLIVAVAPTLGFQEGNGFPSVQGAAWPLILMAVAAAVAAASRSLKRRRGTSIAQALCLLWCILNLAASIALIRKLTPPWTTGLHLAAVVIAAQLGLALAWQLESVLGNAKMRQYSASRGMIVVVAIASGTAIVAGYAFACTQGLRSGAHVAAFLPSFIPMLAAVLLALCVSWGAGAVLEATIGRATVADNGVAHYSFRSSLLQDSALMGLVVAVATWVVGATTLHVPLNAAERGEAIFTLLLSFMIFFSAIFVWTLRNNVSNANRFARWAGRDARSPVWRGLLPVPLRDALRRSGDADATPELYFSRRLDAHIAIQNALACGLVAVTLTGLASIVNEYHDSGRFE